MIHAEGWSKSPVDPMATLGPFKPLRVKNGFILRAYQYYAGGNGNGVVWAMPADAPFPEPDECPRIEGRFLTPPRPPGALDDLMLAVEGNGTPWAYLCASVFCREIHEFGAMWHGIGWGTHTILDKNPLKTSRAKRRPRTDRPSGVQEWTWLEPEPAEWKPHVVLDGPRIKVVFHTFTGHGQETIVRHIDTFREGTYAFESASAEVATGPMGYVF